MAVNTDNDKVCEQLDGNEPRNGPKLLNLNEYKAGLDGLDVEKINKIIHETSKGSNFHSFQMKRQKRIDQQIEEMKKKLSQMTERQRSVSMNECNKLCKIIEQRRDLSRIIVHFDMDMFFAAVEIKHNPSLADKPIAVGSLMMIGTSNYIARTYGVRAAMPGFVAKQLCPQLILIKHNFKNYSKESEAVMKIISQYDPNFNSFSLDEAFIDLTDYVIDSYCDKEPDFDRNSLNDCPELPQFLWDLAYEIVQQIRDRIFSETQLTVSAGISCNTMIAKVCTDVNKPNGQFMVKGYLEEVKEFIAGTPVRKICGIGPVRGQFLSALDIKTCRDLWDKRDIIHFLFSPFNVKYYMRVALGIGTVFMRSTDESQKSHSCERTFGEISDFNEICDKLREISHRLELDLKSEDQTCKTVTLKLKKVSFDVSLKSQTIPYYTNDWETMYNVAKKLLEVELSNTPPNEAKYRLIGLKVSNLRDNEESNAGKGQMTLSGIFRALKTNCNNKLNTSSSGYSSESNYANETLINSRGDDDSDYYECSICSQTFEHKFVFECHENECIDEAYNISASDQQEFTSDCNDNSEQTTDSNDNFEQTTDSNDNFEQTIDSNSNSEQTTDEMNTSSDLGVKSGNECSALSFMCPICSVYLVFKDNEGLNRHIDVCLNKTTCLELTQVPNVTNSSTCSENSTPNQKTRKRTNSGTQPNSKSQKFNPKKESKKSQKTIDFFFRSPQ